MGKGKRIKANRLPKDPVYQVTKSEMESMLTRAMKERVSTEGWMRINDVRKLLQEDMVQCLNAGVEEVLIVLMEHGILGWSRIERDIVPAVKALDKEWAKYMDNDDADTAFAVLDARLEACMKKTKRKLKSHGDIDCQSHNSEVEVEVHSDGVSDGKEVTV